MPSDERGGLPEPAGWECRALLGVSAGDGTGPGGNQQALRVVLATAPTQPVTAGVTEAPPLQSAHQALGHHVVKAFSVLLGYEDPGEHVKHKVYPQRDTMKESAPVLPSPSSEPSLRSPEAKRKADKPAAECQEENKVRVSASPDR